MSSLNPLRCLLFYISFILALLNFITITDLSSDDAASSELEFHKVRDCAVLENIGVIFADVGKGVRLLDFTTWTVTALAEQAPIQNEVVRDGPFLIHTHYMNESPVLRTLRYSSIRSTRLVSSF